MPGEYKLSEYKVLDFFVKHVDLELDLTKEPVQSKALLTIEPNPKSLSQSDTLQLDFENMTLTALSLNGRPLTADEYHIKDNSLIIKGVPQDKSFTLEATTLLGENTDLFGLYQTEGTVLVKAETEGLRRVFPCKDRPDNLATYKTTIIANKKQYPTLLSNGVLTEQKDLDSDTHSVTWTDPIPKPSYLFAIVAGQLTCAPTSYTTKLGRKIAINFHVPEDAVPQSTFAQEVLKAAMKWDEERFDLECLLPEYKVAGVNKYPSGDSEPTGLNLFNTANLFATPESRTDTDILRVIDVVSHEYFHTWTGDFVTIRDWFNLAAKEGLTTFRASLFLEHLLGINLERMLDGSSLDGQTPRPDAYTAVRSLYTSAAYEKSAEVFRMIMNTLGEDAFNKALEHFLKANMGNAVTLENILDSLSEHCNKDVRPFLNWFTQSGIPKVSVSDEYDPENKIYKLKFVTTDGKDRPIPIDIALLNSHGQRMSAKDRTFMVNQAEMVCEYSDIPECPMPSLLRGFSAPVHLDFAYTNEQLLFLMQHDNDLYNKCNAAKILITRMVNDYCSDKTIAFSAEFITTYRNLLLNSKELSTWVLAELLALPSEEALIASLPTVGFEQIAAGRRLIQQTLAQELKTDLQHRVMTLETKPSTTQVLFDMNAAGNRRFKSVCYSYLFAVEPKTTEQALIEQFNKALGHNMTETISALDLLANANCQQLDELLTHFYNYWQKDINAINYWINLQASAHSSNVVQHVEKLMHHPAIDLSNPNKVYALLGTFIKNPYGFHAASGEGYKLVASFILQLERTNPTLAANLTEKFNYWDKYDKKRQQLMLESLQNISAKSVTPDVSAMAKKGLEKAKANLPSQSLAELINWTFLAPASPKPESGLAAPKEDEHLRVLSDL